MLLQKMSFLWSKTIIHVLIYPLMDMLLKFVSLDCNSLIISYVHIGIDGSWQYYCHLLFIIFLIAKMVSLKFLLSFINYLNLPNVSNTYFVQGTKINTADTAMNKLVSLFITPGAYREDTANCQSFTERKEIILCNKNKVLLHSIRWCPHAHLGSWKSVVVLMIMISRIFYVWILGCSLVELFGKD